MTEEKHIFKVGDRVRIIDDSNSSLSICKGDLGTIVNFPKGYPDYIYNDGDFVYVALDNNSSDSGFFLSERFELVKETTEKTHYINGVSVSNNIYTLCFGSEEDSEQNIEINLTSEEAAKLQETLNFEKNQEVIDLWNSIVIGENSNV